MTKERKNMTMKQAIENHLFEVECCNGCGKEACRLYIQMEGTYAHFRYCRSCAIHALKQDYF
jgi:ribosomal protein S26